jgi:triosephosphate isomerase (TIM)
MMTKYLIANWKMNLPAEGIEQFVDALGGSSAGGVELAIAPPFPFLQRVSDAAARLSRSIMTGGQNCSEHESGAYTGEVSAGMLKAAGAGFVIVGHSERRRYFHENDAEIGRKVRAAAAAGLMPVWCVGEDLETRDSGGTDDLLRRQIAEGLAAAGELSGPFVVAYEPVWAIGTGRNASAAMASAAHEVIREALAKEGYRDVPIVYGGSVAPENAGELAAAPHIDGFLVGGASLVSSKFLAVEAGIIASRQG